MPEPETARLTCPACGDERRLSYRSVGPLPTELFDCVACGGFWLDQDAFRALAERARGEEPPPLPARLERPAILLAHARIAPRAYRPCPRCGEMMRRRNYEQKSGVILDVCEQHGIWFDLEELDRLLRWIHGGGKARPQVEVRDAQWEELRRRARVRQAAEPPEPPWYEALNDARWVPWVYLTARLLFLLLAKR